ncbi:hypothetical protein SAMN06272781_6640 [Streptomyces sp. 1222.2]|nr:hypothetical protein SAMN06272781_6640 [Streptomyces sp. 1222.2]
MPLWLPELRLPSGVFGASVARGCRTSRGAPGVDEGAEDGRGGALGRATAPATGGRCGRRGTVGPFPAEGARSGRGGGTEEPPTGPEPRGEEAVGCAPEAEARVPESGAPGAGGRVPAVGGRVARADAPPEAGGHVSGASLSDPGSLDAGRAAVPGGVVDGSWSGGMDGRGGTGGRGGMEARRASVLMHPPFPRPVRPGGRPGVRPPVGSGRQTYRDSPARGRRHHGQAIPAAADPHPRRGRPCVRVTLRVGRRRTGTSTPSRGFCPERPPTLR